MPGPFVHQASIKKTVELLKVVNFPLKVEVGSLLDSLNVDRTLPSHGCDCKVSFNNLVPLFREQLQILETKIRNKEDISDTVRIATHLICDSFSIGQICGTELWGKKDDLIDAACELVCNKGESNSVVFSWNTLDEGLYLLNKEITNTYDTYHKDAVNWFKGFFPLPSPKDVTHMTRRAVSLSASLSASFVLHIYMSMKKN